MRSVVLDVRSDFPALNQKVHGQELIYLDSAATSLKPKCVIDRIQRHYQNETANVHRGIHYLSAEATRFFEETREAIQHFINADSEKECIFTKGTTDSINLVASSWGEKNLKKDDVIILSTMEHHSNIVPWQMLAQKKEANVIACPITKDGELDLEAYQKLFETYKDKIKMVSLVHISNTLGTINPIRELIDIAHQHGALFMVDAAQSVCHMPVDVQALDCDFLAFSAHKMFGPTGVGVLYGKRELLEKMPPYQGGGAMIERVSFEGTTFNQLPEKFEAGTPHIAGVIAFKSAIDYLLSLGFEEIQKHETSLLSYAQTKLQEIEGLKVIGTAKEKTSVISFSFDSIHPHDLGMILDQQGVAIRTGHHCTQPLMDFFNVPATSRASFSIYNTLEDVDKLVSSILKAKELL